MALCGTVGLGDPSRKRMAVVVLCAVAHLLVAVLVLSVFLGAPWESRSASQGSAPFSEYLRRYGLQGQNLTMLRQAAIEFRRQSAPLTLIRRVKDIEAEVAKSSQGQGVEQEQEQEELATERQGEPAIVDDELGVIERAKYPPEKCYPNPHTDFAGDAVRWGLTYHVSSAAECCNACSRQAAFAKAGQRKCNVWVFCPESKGCPSPDRYEHKFGECWLKQADQPRAYVNDYSLLTSVPPMPVLWISGVIPF